jgi:hypothetical protein
MSAAFPPGIGRVIINTHNDVETALYAVRHHLVSMPS